MLTDKNGDMYPYFPHEARIRNLTYQIDTKVDIHIEKKQRKGNQPGKLIERYKKTQIELGKIPVMIHSC